MRTVVRDILAVAKQSRLLILGGGLVSLLGAMNDVSGLVYGEAGWHWPAWYWVLPLPAAVIVAEFQVLRARGEKVDELTKLVEEQQPTQEPPDGTFAIPQAQDISLSDIYASGAGSVVAGEGIKGLSATGVTHLTKPEAPQLPDNRRIPTRSELSERCQKLSQEVNAFLREATPSYPIPVWLHGDLDEDEMRRRQKEDHEAYVARDKELVRGFAERFAAEAEWIFVEVLDLGLIDESDYFKFAHPHQRSVIERIAQKLGVMSKQLSEAPIEASQERATNH